MVVEDLKNYVNKNIEILGNLMKKTHQGSESYIMCEARIGVYKSVLDEIERLEGNKGHRIINQRIPGKENEINC